MNFYLVQDFTAKTFCELLRFPNIRNLIYLTRHLEVKVQPHDSNTYRYSTVRLIWLSMGHTVTYSMRHMQIAYKYYTYLKLEETT